MLLKLFLINICVFFSSNYFKPINARFLILLKPISAHCLHLVWNLKLLPKFARRHGSHHLTHPHLQKLSLSAFLIFLVLQSFVFHIIHSESKESKDSLSHLSPLCVLFAFDRGPIFLLLNLGKTLVDTTTTITIINNKVLLKIRKRALICKINFQSCLSLGINCDGDNEEEWDDVDEHDGYIDTRIHYDKKSPSSHLCHWGSQWQCLGQPSLCPQSEKR